MAYHIKDRFDLPCIVQNEHMKAQLFESAHLYLLKRSWLFTRSLDLHKGRNASWHQKQSVRKS